LMMLNILSEIVISVPFAGPMLGVNVCDICLCLCVGVNNVLV
jgi:hypothetical protein